MISLTSKGDFEKTRRHFAKLGQQEQMKNLDQYGQMGVDALARATPVDTGLTAGSWRYRITKNGKSPGIEWYNTNSQNGSPVAILIQYGHGTGTGGYVQGRDYINPAMRPVFDKIVDAFWKEVVSWQR